jgi:hypothetical protein
MKKTHSLNAASSRQGSGKSSLKSTTWICPRHERFASPALDRHQRHCSVAQSLRSSKRPSISSR